jgi:hypothetical protein
LAQQAPDQPIRTEYGKTHPYVEHFDGYLDQHPEVTEQLRKNPHLIGNPQYLAAHPELAGYLHGHPRMARAFERHPERFMHREHRYDRSERRAEGRHGER